jgi:hypothetical protein
VSFSLKSIGPQSSSNQDALQAGSRNIVSLRIGNLLGGAENRALVEIWEFLKGKFANF